MHSAPPPQTPGGPDDGVVVRDEPQAVSVDVVHFEDDELNEHAHPQPNANDSMAFEYPSTDLGNAVLPPHPPHPQPQRPRAPLTPQEPEPEPAAVADDRLHSEPQQPPQPELSSASQRPVHPTIIGPVPPAAFMQPQQDHDFERDMDALQRFGRWDDAQHVSLV